MPVYTGIFEIFKSLQKFYLRKAERPKDDRFTENKINLVGF